MNLSQTRKHGVFSSNEFAVIPRSEPRSRNHSGAFCLSLGVRTPEGRSPDRIRQPSRKNKKDRDLSRSRELTLYRWCRAYFGGVVVLGVLVAPGAVAGVLVPDEPVDLVPEPRPLPAFEPELPLALG